MTPNGNHSLVHRAAEEAARASYGRLIAMLASRTRDLAAAEDALADAFRSALESWPVRGIPERPEAWLLIAARHVLDRQWRHERVKAAAVSTIVSIAEEAGNDDAKSKFPDERLRLLFVCTHPSIDPAIQAPLMLQTVLGLEATHIASAFLVSPATMGQRLVRAKGKIRDAGIAFDLPDDNLLKERLDAVLSAVYACFGTGWEDVLGADAKLKGLADEAIWLGHLLVDLCPQHAESKGLLALMLYCEARRSARRSKTGEFVPLDQQDFALWSRPMIAEAEALLGDASRAGELGRYQVEAAIQSVHIDRLLTGADRWDALETLYALLVSVAPTFGVRIAQAAVMAEAGKPNHALDLLERLAGDVQAYQPYWATRGHVLRLLSRHDEARASFRSAAGLTEDDAVRSFLLRSADS